MKRYITRVMVLLLAGMLISCGGGGGDDSTSGAGTPAPTNPANGGGDPAPGDGGGDPAPGDGGGDPVPGDGGGDPVPGDGGAGTPPPAVAHAEESDAAVTLSAGWTPSSARWGWSGGAAMESTVAGATATFTFTGTSVTWIGSRGPFLGIALVKVDAGPATEVELYSKAFEARTRVITLNDLSDGPHTLTIEVTGRRHPQSSSNVVVVDAFDVQAPIVSHLQETDPDASFSAGWVHLDDGKWSGGGVRTGSDPAFGGARSTEAAGETFTLKFRGTSISWIGYRGPSAGIARVQVDAGEVREVDLYAPREKIQQVVFTASGLADATHTLRIEATGLKNAASAGALVVVDAFDVTTPGRRFEEGHPAITYTGNWNDDNVNRVWSEGMAATTSEVGARADFSFTGTSVSVIGCEKSSIGTAKIYIDGALVATVNMSRPVGIEGYQRTVFRADGLSNGPHVLTVEAFRGLTELDAFDVHP